MQRRVSIRPKVQMAPTTFLIVNMPSQDLAMTGYIYVHPSDARGAYVTIGGDVYRCAPHPVIEQGHVALNAIQRRLVNKFAGDLIGIEDFLIPMREFDLQTLTVQAEWLKSNVAPVPQDITALANAFRTHFAGQVLTKGQKVLMNYDGQVLLITVKSDVKGLVTMGTEVGVEFVDVV
jgi:hypothetical protein